MTAAQAGSIIGMRAHAKLASRARSSWQWMRIGSCHWQVHVQFAQPDFLARLANPAELMLPPARILRPRTQSATTEVAHVVLPELPDTPLIVKRYYPGTVWQRLKGLFRIPRARKAFQLAFFLQSNGLPTAVPVAALASRWPGRKCAFLITAEVRPALRLYEFNQSCPIQRKRRAVIRAFAHLMASLHNLGLVHTDPSLTNFLVTRAPDCTWRLFLVDLDGLRSNRWFGWRRELKSLQQLAARAATTARERLVFLATYCRARRPPLAARQVAKQIRLPPLPSRSDITPSSVPIDSPQTS